MRPGAIQVARAPGRVNLIGEYTDFNLGYVLPAAIDREIRIAFVPTDDRRVVLHRADTGERTEFDLDRLPGRSGTWPDYAVGTAWAMAAAGLEVRGAARGDRLEPADRRRAVVVGGDRAGGCRGAPGRPARPTRADGPRPDRPARRERLRRRPVRPDGPVRRGLRPGRRRAAARLPLARLATGGPAPRAADPRRLRQRPGARRWPAPSTTFAVRSATRRSASWPITIRRSTRCATYRSSCIGDAAARGWLEPVVLRRATHVVHENQRVLQAIRAFETGDLPAIGRLFAASHASLRDLFEVELAGPRCARRDRRRRRRGSWPPG